MGGAVMLTRFLSSCIVQKKKNLWLIKEDWLLEPKHFGKITQKRKKNITFLIIRVDIDFKIKKKIISYECFMSI